MYIKYVPDVFGLLIQKSQSKTIVNDFISVKSVHVLLCITKAPTYGFSFKFTYSILKSNATGV